MISFSLANVGCQRNVLTWVFWTAKERSLLGGWRHPRKRVCLAVNGSQEKMFTWRSTAAKKRCLLSGRTFFHGALKFLTASYYLGRQTAKEIILGSWLPRMSSFLGSLYLAVGRQKHLPWRFTYIPWRDSTAKVNLVSGSVPAVVLAAKRPGHEFSRKKNSTPVRLTMGRDKPSDFNVNHYCKI